MIWLVLAAALMNPQHCEKGIDSIRLDALDSLRRVESHFANAAWQYQRYRETVYVPLWDAVHMRRDRFSPERQVQGKVLALRYHEEARVYRSLAQEETRSMFRAWRRLLNLYRTFPAVCEVQSFQNCSYIWQDQMLERLRLLGQLLHRYDGEQRDLNRRAARAMFENPSEHHNFGERFQETYERWQVKITPQLLGMIRDIRERAAVEVPGNCCAQCREEELAITQDPVISRVKPDPQSAESMTGKVTNQSGLMPAFTVMDEAEDRKDRESAG